ncbi:MAG: hypothetical protein ACNI28_01870 [Arcobacter sp.]|uniref:hypothetical protein n=1 Tax=Arcobacter sp. TaxID=1872629 RepID=UPI003AFF9DB3
MRVLISYPTNIGIFDIGQSEDKKYHPIFDDTSLGAFTSIQEAVDKLITNKTIPVIDPNTNKEVDTSTLDIPQDYTQWDTSY